MTLSNPLPPANRRHDPQKIRCVVVEDQVMFEQMLRTILQTQGFFEVVGVAHTVESGLALCESFRPELLLLDLELPDGNGLDVANKLVEQCPDSRTIILSGHAATFKCPPNLRRSIYSVLDKTMPVEMLLGELLEFHRKFRAIDPVASKMFAPAKILSTRELQVFRLIGEGLSSKEIAARLGSAYLTIETHRRNICAKLATSGAELVKMAALYNQMASLGGG